MKPTIKKEIVLNENLTKRITELNNEIKLLQSQIEVKNNTLLNLVIGVCLNDGLDLTKEGVQMSEDFSKLFVYDLPQAAPAIPEMEVVKSKKGK